MCRLRMLPPNAAAAVEWHMPGLVQPFLKWIL